MDPSSNEQPARIDRYHRQSRVAVIGQAGQLRLSKARVLLIGCGALGTVIAEQMVRGGVGWLRIADRDLVELTNLQRQVLFDEHDASESIPKAIAAEHRLREINSTIQIDPRVLDVNSINIEMLCGLTDQQSPVDLILDGTDNAAIRYLINDVSVKHGIPWVYGACIGIEGRVSAIIPGTGPCLRCLFETPPPAGSLATCDTAGVLAPVAAMVASMQVIFALKFLVGESTIDHFPLWSFDLWAGRSRPVSILDGRRSDCPCCGKRQFEFLESDQIDMLARLCGRQSVQVLPSQKVTLDLKEIAQRLGSVGKVEQKPYFLRCQLSDPPGIGLTVFPDGRVLVHGTEDAARAKSICARFIGI
ncbi:MAG: ThiF family adenylyltransferase [Phycisphaerales bacterium]|jgi:adenylyltransferase/sulfurtransferase|nr:ThiF family adenylyltransferase [Phycisphaerales bacterium]